VPSTSWSTYSCPVRQQGMILYSDQFRCGAGRV